MSSSANRPSRACDVSGEGGIGTPNGITSVTRGRVPYAAVAQVLVQQDRGLARRGRALERVAAHADHRVPRGEGRQAVACPHRAVERVELVAAGVEPGRRAGVVVGAERDDEHVGVVGLEVGDDPHRLGVDRHDRLLTEAHAGLRHPRVRDPDRLGRCLAEQQVELREAEDERVALVDQGAVELVADRVGQARGEFEPAEARAEDHDPHGVTLRAGAERHSIGLVSPRRRSQTLLPRRPPASVPAAVGRSDAGPLRRHGAGTPRRTEPRRPSRPPERRRATTPSRPRRRAHRRAAGHRPARPNGVRCDPPHRAAPRRYRHHRRNPYLPAASCGCSVLLGGSRRPTNPAYRWARRLG